LVQYSQGISSGLDGDGGAWWYGHGMGRRRIAFDASRSSSVYGAADDVHPRSMRMMVYRRTA